MSAAVTMALAAGAAARPATSGPPPLFDRRRFFRAVRESIFRGRLSRQQVAGMEALLTAWEREWRMQDMRHLAYCFATAWHETAHTMQPVRETLAKSDRQAIARLRKWARKVSPRRRQTVLEYARVHPSTGKAYFGRGYVQLTWRRNYRRLGERLGIDLERHPELAMRPDIAARILYCGMIEGLFTGRKLEEFIRGEHCDYVAARQTVNGLDRARLIAGVAEEFQAALAQSLLRARQEWEVSTAPPPRPKVVRLPGEAAPQEHQPAPPPEIIEGRPVPETGKPAWRSTTIIAALLAVLARGAAALNTVPASLKWTGLALGLAAVAWIIRERMRHAREDGV